VLNDFGEFLHNRRKQLNFTLREFCEKHDLDPGNWSKLERGKLPPPQSTKRLAQIAKYLGLKKGTEEWQTYIDLAFSENGRIPDDIMSEEELVQHLPLFFRSMRGESLTEEQIQNLIEIIKGA
jgi:transcriptional regulator with XRE-family HTH domain